MNLSKAKQYSAIKYRIYFCNLILSFCFFILFQFFVSPKLANFSYQYFNPIFLSLIAYLLFFCIAYYLVFLPLGFYSSYVLEHKFNLSNLSIKKWVIDEVKRNLLELPLFLILFLLLYVVLINFENIWWMIAAFSWMGLSIIFAKLLPIFVIPLFYKYSDIPDEDLKSRIGMLAKKANIKLMNVFQIDFSKKTKKANAALVGVGKTKRVILADNLVNGFSCDEVEVVCAHEFGHYKLKHLWKLLLFHSVTTFFGFFLLSILLHKIAGIFHINNIYDLTIFPSILLVLSIFGTVVLPIQNAFSRYLEKQADVYALKLTRNKQGFTSLMEKLAQKNLADQNPPLFIKLLIFDHPPIKERLMLADEYDFGR